MSSRRPDDEPPGLPPEWANFVVPDDISELDPEVHEVRREFNQTGPVGPLRRLLETRRWKRYGLSGPLVLIVLLVVLFFASLVFLLLPSGPSSPPIKPLARPRVAPGSTGGLLPDVALPVGTNDSVRLRNLRPAVVIIVAAHCGCASFMTDVIRSTSPSRLQVLFVGEGGDPELPSTAPSDRVHAGADTDGRLAAIFRAGPGPTTLFVGSDGTVRRVLRNTTSDVNLHDEVAGLLG